MTDQLPSGRTADTDFMFTKLAVDDIEKSANFYGSVVGLVEMHRLDATIVGDPVREVVYQATYPGGPMLVLMQFEGAPSVRRGEVMLGFSTRDLSAFIARLEQAGGHVLGTTEDAVFKTAFVKDPAGHKLQITQSLG